MIRSFEHKGPRRLFEEDDRRLIRPDHALLDAAAAVDDLVTPSLRPRPLKGDLKGISH